MHPCGPGVLVPGTWINRVGDVHLDVMNPQFVAAGAAAA
jgi:hypothetical protein